MKRRPLSLSSSLSGSCTSSSTCARSSAGPTRVGAVGDEAEAPLSLSQVFDWPDGPFHGRPRLRAWFARVEASVPAAARVRAEMDARLRAKEASGGLEKLIAEARAPGFKWRYP